MIEIPPIIPVVKEYRLHSLVCACCSTRSCAELPGDVEPSRNGPRLSALVGMLDQPVAYGDETGDPTGNADGGNPDR